MHADSRKYEWTCFKTTRRLKYDYAERVRYQIALNMLNEYSTILGTAMAWSWFGPRNVWMETVEEDELTPAIGYNQVRPPSILQLQGWKVETLALNRVAAIVWD